jgi:hypothetical protein
MGDLFGVDVRTLSEHLRNVYESGELAEGGNFPENPHGSNRGKSRSRARGQLLQLDAITSDAYRVSSARVILKSARGRARATR